MDLLVETLRVVREIRDWAQTRASRTPAAERTRLALEQAVSSTQTALGALEPPVARPASSGPLLEPLGPAKKAPVVETARRSFPPDSLDPHAVSAVRRLRKAGYKAYLVGGCVRDLLLGMTPKDFDVSTDARPEEVKAVFRNSRIIGRRFRLVHLYYRGGKIIEVATFRANVSPSEDDQDDLLIRRDNVYGSEEEDAQRRDFTINGLFYDVARERIIDHVGGLHDIDARYLRMIGDPDVRLREDPVRVLRAVRFVAKNELAVDPELEEAIRTHRHDLVRCAPARLLEETLKLFRAGYAEPTVRKMVEWEVLPVLLPEMAAFVAGEAPFEDSETPPGPRLFDHLRALDTVVRRGPVGDAVVIGAFIMAPVALLQDRAEAAGEDRSRVLSEFLDDFGRRITLTRRIQEQLRQIFQAQRHMGRAGGGRRRRRGSNSSLLQRSFFGDALALYEVRCRALGLPLDEVAQWHARADQAGAEVGPPPDDAPAATTEADEGPPPSRETDEGEGRSRRGGRRRRTARQRAAAPDS
jgi:poly(A) polymerase